MNLPSREALDVAYCNNVWGEVAHIETLVEAEVRDMGDRFACDGVSIEVTEFGMHISQSIGTKGAHVEIDASPGLIYAQAFAPGARKASGLLSGEVVTDKLFHCAQLLGSFVAAAAAA